MHWCSAAGYGRSPCNHLIAHRPSAKVEAQKSRLSPVSSWGVESGRGHRCSRSGGLLGALRSLHAQLVTDRALKKGLFNSCPRRNRALLA